MIHRERLEQLGRYTSKQELENIKLGTKSGVIDPTSCEAEAGESLEGRSLRPAMGNTVGV